MLSSPILALSSPFVSFDCVDMMRTGPKVVNFLKSKYSWQTTTFCLFEQGLSHHCHSPYLFIKNHERTPNPKIILPLIIPHSICFFLVQYKELLLKVVTTIKYDGVYNQLQLTSILSVITYLLADVISSVLQNIMS